MGICMCGRLYMSSDTDTNIDQDEISFPYQVLQPSEAVKLSPALYRRPPTVHVLVGPVGGVEVPVGGVEGWV